MCNFQISSTDIGLCVEMDFMRTFQASTKCNNRNTSVCSHFYQVVHTVGFILNQSITSRVDREHSYMTSDVF